ncbi:MAG: chloride channel protein, partial [Candidatus Thorarchaeota archaeon]|nr:chloride channel protein [Candidatus Thorarchaeota archaeon]
MPNIESDANIGEKVTPIRDIFHFTHFKSFYTLYVPIAIIIGVVAGLAMVVFQWLIVGFTQAFSILPVYVAPIIGGAFSGLLIYLGRTEVQGSGISTAIQMTHEPSSLPRG